EHYPKYQHATIIPLSCILQARKNRGILEAEHKPREDFMSLFLFFAKIFSDAFEPPPKILGEEELFAAVDSDPHVLSEARRVEDQPHLASMTKRLLKYPPPPRFFAAVFFFIYIWYGACRDSTNERSVS